MFASIFQFENLLKSIFMLHNRNYKIAKTPNFIDFLVHNAISVEIKKALILLASLDYGNYGLWTGIPQPPPTERKRFYIYYYFYYYIYLSVFSAPAHQDTLP